MIPGGTRVTPALVGAVVRAALLVSACAGFLDNQLDTVWLAPE